MDQLLNVENAWNGVAVADAVEGPCESITLAEVEKALRCLKKGKAAGPSGITTEMIQACEEECLPVLKQVAQDMLDGGQMPASWRKSTLVPIFKGKGSPLDCSNYRGVKLGKRHEDRRKDMGATTETNGRYWADAVWLYAS